jgi:hypothetical protein
MSRLLIALCAVLLVALPVEAAKRKRPPAAATPTVTKKPPAKGPTKKPAPKPGQKSGKKPAKPAASDATDPNAPVPAAAPSADTAVSPATIGVKTEGKGKLKSYDFTAMSIEGKVLTPQIMYLLGRIKVELEKSDLEKRSFIPELVRSADEGGI